MSARPLKRSVTLHGHRTSVSLEEPFWRELSRLAEAEGVAVNALVQRIDEARGVSEGEGGEAGLASAIRVWVLERALEGR